eukprot:g3866.t1
MGLCIVKDAELFRDTIKEAGFEIFSYKVNSECTSDSMKKVLDDVINRFDDVTNAQFIFYYAGHGVKDKRSRGWFALNKYNNKDRHTKFLMSDLTNISKEIGAIQQLYVLDCCHAGELFSGRRNVQETFAMELASKPCAFGMTAVTGDQEAIEENGHGLFTKTLCYGIGKDQHAMRNKPYATSNDLLEFVQIRVHEKSNNKMQPLGEKMLIDHFDEPCTGQFIMFHEETINHLKASHEVETGVVSSTGNTRGVGVASAANNEEHSIQEVRQCIESKNASKVIEIMWKFQHHAGIQREGCEALWRMIRPAMDTLYKDADHAMEVTIAKEGGIQRILKSMNEHASSAGVQEQGCWALRNLAGNDDNEVTIAKDGGIQRILKSMNEHASSAAVQENG